MDYSRREALALGAAGIAGTAGCSSSPITGDDQTTQTDTRTSAAPTATNTTPPLDQMDPLDVRGALYLPARAFNHYQMWTNYDRDVIERDMGYASRVNLNAIRTWANFEFWKEDPDAHLERLEHFLAAADDEGMQVLFGLFDAIGKEPNQRRLENTDLMTATAVQSPADAIVDDRDRWDETREFVRWFMENFRDDDRLLGIEAMNEPGWREGTKEFTHGMFETMKEYRGSVPLTVGSTSIANDVDYAEWGSDILQFHYNFPQSQSILADALRQTEIIRERTDKPVWLTEWQRVRSGRGFHSAPAPGERVPNYSSMAPVIQSHGFGNFFWSLMLKPAHVKSQRQHGILNGLFHEDGAVWSLDDARAIKAMSGDPSYDGPVRTEWPDWLTPVKRAGQS